MDKRSEGLKAFAEMLSPEAAAQVDNAANGKGFAREMGELTLSNVFGALWTRPGLDRRSRSLVTLGILIALRAADELEYHIRIARKNGCTVEEIEEIIYHATAYAGFPAANLARSVAAKVLAR